MELGDRSVHNSIMSQKLRRLFLSKFLLTEKEHGANKSDFFENFAKQQFSREDAYIVLGSHIY